MAISSIILTIKGSQITLPSVKEKQLSFLKIYLFPKGFSKNLGLEHDLRDKSFLRQKNLHLLQRTAFGKDIFYHPSVLRPSTSLLFLSYSLVLVLPVVFIIQTRAISLFDLHWSLYITDKGYGINFSRVNPPLKGHNIRLNLKNMKENTSSLISRTCMYANM